MAFAVADRVKETTTTTGTGTVNLGGALDTFQTFVAGVGGGNTTYYSIFHQTANEWEVGIGTVTDAATDTLSRDTIISSSNGGSAVNFSAGTKDVICTLPSSKSYILDNAGDTTISADLSVTSISGSGAGLTTLNASNVSSGTLDNARLSAIPNSALENSAITLNGTGVSLGGSLNLGDIEGVTAGSGLTGGGTTGTVTLNVGAGTGIDVAADAISVDVSDFMSNGSNNRVLTAAGTDSINAESTMTYTGGILTIADSPTPRIFVTDTTNSVSAKLMADDNYAYVGSHSNHPFRILANNAAQIELDTSGNLQLFNGTLTAPGATFTANVSLGDSDFLRLGDSQDLLIFHNGSDSFIDDTGTGDLKIRGSSSVLIEKYTGETMATFNQDGSVDLYHNNNKKFETTATGVDVTGTILTDKAYIALATLTDGATINWDMSTQSVAKVTLGGNRTMAAPTNGSTGQFASITVIQDGTGTRTLTWNAVFEFKDDAAPTLTSTGGKGDLFVFQYNGSKWLEVGRNLNLTQS